MEKKLLIVESPAKAKTIEGYLEGEFIVLSSVGHIRDLAKSGKDGLGIDFEDNYKQKYVISKDKKSVVKQLKAAQKEVSEVYIATDPDREGEAIAWHLIDELGLEEKKKNRVVFNEITKTAIIEAIKKPRELDVNMVDSQKVRRILDRIIGFKLSKLLQVKKVGKSAGRVQSVALRLIVEREREIEAFIPEEYHTIHAEFNDLETELSKYKNKKPEIKTQEEADVILNSLTDEYKVAELSSSDKKRNSKLPFITSTLQQEAINKLGMGSSRSMRVAQGLYEGIKINGELIGLITYMRTDSSRLSAEFVKTVMGYVSNTFGKEYVGFYKGKKGEQDAHEAIRVTSVNRTPESIEEYLDKDQLRLYKLIYARTVASLMAPAVVTTTKLLINNNECEFKATAQKIKFEGYLKVIRDFEKVKENDLPILEVGTLLKCTKVENIQHFTKPKARYSEATLIKEMEENGIGRPATYSQTMSNISTRGYVNLEEKRFKPTDKGVLKNSQIEAFFNDFINVEFTKDMENHLDNIAIGEDDGVDTVGKFIETFYPLIDNAYDKMEKIPDEETGEKCPKCESAMVKRSGRYGDFEACSNFPECKYIKGEEDRPQPVDTGVLCPKCKKANFVERVATRGRNKGNKFYGCANYPKCKNIVNELPEEE